jgi:hypothetical protein
VGSQTIKSASTSSGTGLLTIVHLRNHIISYPSAHISNDLIDVGSSLREYVSCTYLENSQHKRPRISTEPPLRNSRLKCTSHTRQDEVLICSNVVCGILFPRHTHCWVRNGLSPAAICHTNKPTLVVQCVVVDGVRLVNLRVLWC